VTRTLLNPEYVLQGVDSILADLRSPLGYWLMVRLSHQQEMVTPSAYNSFRQEVMNGPCSTFTRHYRLHLLLVTPAPGPLVLLRSAPPPTSTPLPTATTSSLPFSPRLLPLLRSPPGPPLLRHGSGRRRTPGCPVPTRRKSSEWPRSSS
jgi:hypothetical protein